MGTRIIERHYVDLSDHSEGQAKNKENLSFESKNSKKLKSPKSKIRNNSPKILNNMKQRFDNLFSGSPKALAQGVVTLGAFTSFLSIAAGFRLKFDNQSQDTSVNKQDTSVKNNGDCSGIETNEMQIQRKEFAEKYDLKYSDEINTDFTSGDIDSFIEIRNKIRENFPNWEYEKYIFKSSQYMTNVLIDKKDILIGKMNDTNMTKSVAAFINENNHKHIQNLVKEKTSRPTGGRRQ